MKIGVRFVLFVGVLLAGLAAAPAFAAPGETKQTQTTDHYKITLTLGPAATMLMPDQAAGAKAGEVTVPMPGMPMPPMSMTDQGQPVNHHLEIAIVDKTSGAVVTDQMPAITLKNDTRGTSRGLESAMAMYDIQVGKQDIHFGNNLYLADGTYTVTAVVNGETATFSQVRVGASGNTSGGNLSGGNVSGGAMSGGSTSGGTNLPTTGESLTPLYAALLAASGLALGAGLLLRRVRQSA